MAGVASLDAPEMGLEDEIAELAMRQFQAAAAARGGEAAAASPAGAAGLGGRGPPLVAEERRAGAGGGGGEGGGSAASTSRPAEVLTTAELAERLAREAEEMDKDLRAPMAPAEYRRRQAMGIRPEVPGVGERLAQRYPHLLLQPPAGAGGQPPRRPAEDADAMAKARASSGVAPCGPPSQMPAVAPMDGGGCLTKTIEHYTFVDSEDSATVGVHFDKHLWDGAAGRIAESQVLVEVRATSLDVRLKGVPVGPHTEALADWRLSLSPLFSRVEPLLATHRVRNGKLTVRLAKARAGAWKRAVK